MSEKVPNVYKHILVSGRDDADRHAREIRSALNKASLALVAGAWRSGKADDFGAALSHHRSRLQNLADNERDTIDAEVRLQPDEVEPHTWQADFARISKNVVR